MIPPGRYTWKQFASEYLIGSERGRLQRRLRHRIGGFYDGDFQSLELTSNVRVGSRFVGSLGWTRQHAELPGGDFTTDLIPVKASYAFTTLASVQALVQYNSQIVAVFIEHPAGAARTGAARDCSSSSTIARDTSDFNPLEVLGRSFIVKYTRLFDF